MRQFLFKLCLFITAVSLVCISIFSIGNYVTGIIDTRLRAKAARLSSRAEIKWRSVRIRPLHLDVVLNEVEIKAASGHIIGIDRISLSGSFKLPDKLDYLTVRMGGIRFHEIPGYTADPSEPAFFYDLYGRKASLHLDFFYDPVLHHLSIKKFKLTDPAWGELRLKLALNHFYPGRLWDLDFEALEFQTVDLQYWDTALLKRFLENNSKDILEFREFMAEAVQLSIDTAADENNFDRLVSLGGLHDFFEHPGRLIFTLQLRRPVTIPLIMNVRRVSDLLDMVSYDFTNV